MGLLVLLLIIAARTDRKRSFKKMCSASRASVPRPFCFPRTTRRSRPEKPSQKSVPMPPNTLELCSQCVSAIRSSRPAAKSPTKKGDPSTRHTSRHAELVQTPDSWDSARREPKSEKKRPNLLRQQRARRRRDNLDLFNIFWLREWGNKNTL